MRHIKKLSFLTIFSIILSFSSSNIAQAGVILQKPIVGVVGGLFLVLPGLAILGTSPDCTSWGFSSNTGHRFCTSYRTDQGLTPTSKLIGWSAIGVGLAMILLDADTAAQTSNIEQGLKIQYPFVDNGESIQNLAQEIQAKLPVIHEFSDSKDESFEINFSENEIRDIFQDADMSEDNLQILIQDLG